MQRLSIISPFQCKLLSKFEVSNLDDEIGELLEYSHLIKHPNCRMTWSHSYRNEKGRLAKRMLGRATGTTTIFFIHKKDIPQEQHKDTTCSSIICNYREDKAKPNRTRLTVGGDRINYHDNCGTLTADLLTVKLFLNSIISTPKA